MAAAPEPRRHVVITGLMGIGKSTAATALAGVLGLDHRDSDGDLERLFGRTGGELAQEHGVAELHRLEAAVLLGALAGPDPVVVSAAASVVDDERCRQALAARATVVVLDAPLAVVAERMAAGRHRRPMPRSELASLAQRREPRFAQVADVRVDATQTPAQVAAAVRAGIQPWWPGAAHDEPTLKSGSTSPPGPATVPNADPAPGPTPAPEIGWRQAFDNSEVNRLHAAAFATRLHLDDEWDWVGLVDDHSMGWVTARSEGRLIGFANVITDGFVHAWLQDVMVDPADQRAGVGTRLVALAADRCRAAGCEWLHADFDDDVADFYFRACGFEPTSAGLLYLQ